MTKKRQQFKVHEAVHSYVQPKMTFVSKALTFLKQQSLSGQQTRPVTSHCRFLMPGNSTKIITDI